MRYQQGDTVYWIEPPSTIRSGTVVRRTGSRYIVRRGYEAGVMLPESRLFPTYDAAAATLPTTEGEKRTGRWHWWVG